MSDVDVIYPPELLPRPEPGDEVEVYAYEYRSGDQTPKFVLVWQTGEHDPQLVSAEPRVAPDTVQPPTGDRNT